MKVCYNSNVLKKEFLFTIVLLLLWKMDIVQIFIKIIVQPCCNEILIPLPRFFLSTCNCIYFDFVYLYLFEAIYICLLLSIWVYVNNSSYVDRKKGSIERKVSIFWQLKSWQT